MLVLLKKLPPLGGTRPQEREPMRIELVVRLNFSLAKVVESLDLTLGIGTLPPCSRARAVVGTFETINPAAGPEPPLLGVLLLGELLRYNTASARDRRLRAGDHSPAVPVLLEPRQSIALIRHGTSPGRAP